MTVEADMEKVRAAILDMPRLKGGPTKDSTREALDALDRIQAVVEAAREYVAVPRTAERPEPGGPIVFDFTPQQDAMKKLEAALAVLAVQEKEQRHSCGHKLTTECHHCSSCGGLL